MSEVDAALAALNTLGSAKVRDGYARFGIVTADPTLGIPMLAIQKLAKQLGKSHALARDLWQSGIYEARLLAAYVDEPARVTAAQMDRWASQFDNWATCDQVCFSLFDRTAHTFDKIHAWATSEREFVKRAAFALIASVAVHDKGPIEKQLLATLPLCERAADDDRNFVKKGVSWALRATGTRDAALHAAVTALGTRLAAREEKAARWIGRDVLRDLARPVVARRIARLAKARKPARPAKRANAPAPSR